MLRVMHLWMMKVKFVRDKVKARRDADYPVVTPDQVELMDVSPQQIASIAASFDSVLGT